MKLIRQLYYIKTAIRYAQYNFDNDHIQNLVGSNSMQLGI